jgi:hypothetical protein
LERRIRAAKRQVAALDPFGPGPDLTRARTVVARASAELKTHVDENDLKRLRYREQIGQAR